MGWFIPSHQLTWKCKTALSKRNVVFLQGSVHKSMLAGGRVRAHSISDFLLIAQPPGQGQLDDGTEIRTRT